MTLGANAERHNPAAAITDPDHHIIIILIFVIVIIVLLIIMIIIIMDRIISPITVVSLQPSLFVIQLAIGPDDDNNDDKDDNDVLDTVNIYRGKVR